MPLEFDTARVSVPVAPQRTDIACFVGYVRSRNLPLPKQVTADLRAAGWVDGPWRRDESQRRTLEQLPVAVDSWDAFDQLFDWIKETRTTGVAGKRKSVTITLHDEAQTKVQSWVLANVIPMKYTGPTLAAKGGGDVAMEELVLAAEGMVIEK